MSVFRNIPTKTHESKIRGHFGFFLNRRLCIFFKLICDHTKFSSTTLTPHQAWQFFKLDCSAAKLCKESILRGVPEIECTLACVCALMTPSFITEQGLRGHTSSPWQQLPLADSICITVATLGLGVYWLGALEYTTPSSLTPLFFVKGFGLMSIQALHVCSKAIQTEKSVFMNG